MAKAKSAAWSPEWANAFSKASEKNMIKQFFTARCREIVTANQVATI
jgi:hypothetical protein